MDLVEESCKVVLEISCDRDPGPRGPLWHLSWDDGLWAQWSPISARWGSPSSAMITSIQPWTLMSFWRIQRVACWTRAYMLAECLDSCKQRVLWQCEGWNLGTRVPRWQGLWVQGLKRTWSHTLFLPKVLIIDDDQFPSNDFEEAQLRLGVYNGYTMYMSHVLISNLYVDVHI